MDESALKSLIAALEKSLSSLGSWLNFWTVLVVVGVFFEVAFVFHEHFDDRGDWWKARTRGVIEPPSKPSIPWLIFEILSVALVVLGVAGELYINVVAGRIETKLRSANSNLVVLLEGESANALETAGKANERAAFATRETEYLRKEAEDERLARVKIEARVAWRTLGEQQKNDIGAGLGRSFSDQGVSVWYNASDIEAALFADDIAEAVTRAKTLRVYSPAGILLLQEGGPANLGKPIVRLPTGVFVEHSENPKSLALSKAIVEALVNLGFDATLRAHKLVGNENPTQVWVDVQPRPNGPQGEYKLQAKAKNIIEK